MHKELEKDLYFIFPEEVGNIITRSGALVCGGAIVSTACKKPINDYDLFFYTPEKYYLCKKLLNDSPNFRLKGETPNAVTFIDDDDEITVQAVCLVFGPPDLIFKHFDFYCCMTAYSLNERKLYAHSEALEDIKNRRLVYNTNSSYPLRSLIRAKKYTEKKGFSLSNTEMLKIALSIQNLDLTKYSDLRQNLEAVYPDPQFLSAMKDVKDEGDNAYDFQHFIKKLEKFNSRPKPVEEITEVRDIPF